MNRSFSSSAAGERSTEVECDFGDCPNCAARDGLCWGHLKQRQEGKPLTELEQRPQTPRDRLREAAYALAEAPSDDDGAFERADNNLLKAALGIRRRSFADAIYAGLRKARRKGKRLGRPPALESERVKALVTLLGIRGAARELQVDRNTVRRALRRAGVKTRDSAPRERNRR